MAKVDDELREIRGYLSRWISEVKMANAMTHYDINRVSEGIAQQLLNGVAT